MLLLGVRKEWWVSPLQLSLAVSVWLARKLVTKGLVVKCLAAAFNTASKLSPVTSLCQCEPSGLPLEIFSKVAIFLDRAVCKRSATLTFMVCNLVLRVPTVSSMSHCFNRWGSASVRELTFAEAHCTLCCKSALSSFPSASRACHSHSSCLKSRVANITSHGVPWSSSKTWHR